MEFTKEDRKTLQRIIASRRDVRGNYFTNKKISKKKLATILKSAQNSPSVGYSQPYRFMIVEDKDKEKIYKHFKKSFDKSKEKFKDRPEYEKLKLEGIKESYINLAVFYKKPDKDILGQTFMKRSGEYSVVCAILNMWLTARSMNIGMGWVSILKPKKVKHILNVSNEYKLIAYLCVGYTKEFLDEPELKKLGWEKKKSLKELMLNKENK